MSSGSKIRLLAPLHKLSPLSQTNAMSHLSSLIWLTGYLRHLLVLLNSTLNFNDWTKTGVTIPLRDTLSHPLSYHHPTFVSQTGERTSVTRRRYAGNFTVFLCFSKAARGGGARRNRGGYPGNWGGGVIQGGGGTKNNLGTYKQGTRWRAIIILRVAVLWR